MTEIIKKYRHTIICVVILLLLSIMGTFMVFLRFAVTKKPEFIFLIWNLFLSWIPMGISVIMSWIYSSSTRWKAVFLLPLGAIWLLFYPNAPYMITDFIHFRNNHTFLIWYDLVIYSTFIWTSFLLGFISMYLVKRIIEKASNHFVSWLFVLSVLFLSSYAIYIGRFIRFNSWDMLLSPSEIINCFIENIHMHSIIFSLIYGALLTMLYAFLYALTYLKLEKID